MVSLAALGAQSSNGPSVISKSLERVQGVDSNSIASAQNNIQMKLRLKTTKQYKFITER